MSIGENIYSSATKNTYIVCQVLPNSGQAELAYAQVKGSDQIFFLKKLINVRYAPSGINNEKSIAFENERRKIYRTINMNTMPGATCSYIYDFFNEKTFYYIVTEKVEGVPLKTQVLSKVLPIEERLSLFNRIVYSFLPLESGSIIHGDVKPDNILLKYVNAHLGIRLIDFETSFFSSTPPAKGYIVGTEPYYSPELALYNDDSNRYGKEILSTKSDIFALGVILYELLTGSYPTSSEGKLYCYELISKGISINMPIEWSTGLKTLLKDMLAKNPALRPGILDVVERIKRLPDKSKKSAAIFPPEIIVQRVDGDKAIVSLFCYNPQSEIEYSLDGGGMSPYTTPFIIEEDDIEIKILVKTKNETKVISETFSRTISVYNKRSIKTSRPVININDGIVTILCSNTKASIFYTLDGSTPTKHSRKYNEVFFVGDHIRIKAFARCVGMLPSDIASSNSSSTLKKS